MAATGLSLEETAMLLDLLKVVQANLAAKLDQVEDMSRMTQDTPDDQASARRSWQRHKARSCF